MQQQQQSELNRSIANCASFGISSWMARLAVQMKQMARDHLEQLSIRSF